MRKLRIHAQIQMSKGGAELQNMVPTFLEALF